MRSNPERLAWTVLIAAFLTFCVLITGVPLGVRSFLLHASGPQKARLQVIEGTVLVRRANGAEPIGLTATAKGADLLEGEEIFTDGTSWARLDLFDRSSIVLYATSSAKLVRMRAPRFGLSRDPAQIALALTGGLMRVGVAMPGERRTEFRVITPHATLDLDEGSYRIEVTNELSQVTVDRGEARVTGPGATTLVPQGMRTWVDLNGVVGEPVPAARNVVANGDFRQPLEPAWRVNIPSYPAITLPTVEVVEEGGRNVVRFLRREPDDGNHTEASVDQKLDFDVRDYTSLIVSLDVMLEFQSLSGGGQLSSEFPLQVRLDYKDRWGNDQFWTRGFYYQNQSNYWIALDPWGQPMGEQILRGVWYPFESGNLLELLGENRPVHLTRLTIYASGWNYESLVSEVQLIVE